MVELMVAFAIISLLASIAIPSYLRFVSVAKTTAGKSELGALRISFDSEIGGGNVAPSLADLGTMQRSSNCEFSVLNNSDGTASLNCTLLNPPYAIGGGIVSLTRSSTGAWTCQVNAAIGATYAPNGCTVGS